jgi:hypothetical protein
MLCCCSGRLGNSVISVLWCAAGQPLALFKELFDCFKLCVAAKE